MKRTLLTLAALSSISFAADWPTWRGPKRDDISTEKNLLTEWPAGGPALAWKTTGCGSGYASVSVANGRVFTMGDAPEGSSVRAFEEKSGQPLWVSEIIGKPGGNYEGPRCTPTVDGDSVYALGQFGDFVCLDAATGKERWRKNLGTDFGGRYSGWNYSESPLVDGNLVLFTPGGKKGAIVALDKKTGSLLWQSTAFTDGHTIPRSFPRRSMACINTSSSPPRASQEWTPRLASSSGVRSARGRQPSSPRPFTRITKSM